MKHWMAITVAAVVATGLSLANGVGKVDAVVTPGLPAGWVAEGLVAGQDDVGVARPRDGAPADLVIVKRHDSPAGKPLNLYQTIDATPWRGRTIVFSYYARIQMEPGDMRRLGDVAVAEFSIECDGKHPGSSANVIKVADTRVWLESNLPLKVADDATRCSFGVASQVPAEIRLSKLRFKDRQEEREAYLARRWPEWVPPDKSGSIYTPGATENALTITQPNLEFKQ